MKTEVSHRIDVERRDGGVKASMDRKNYIYSWRQEGVIYQSTVTPTLIQV